VLADLIRPAGSHPIEYLENRPINLLEPAYLTAAQGSVGGGRLSI
jgi:hypothetical protein